MFAFPRRSFLSSDRMINELNRGYPLRRAAPSQAVGHDIRSDKQIDRAGVLEVRIHSPPAESRTNFGTWVIEGQGGLSHGCHREMPAPTTSPNGPASRSTLLRNRTLATHPPLTILIWRCLRLGTRAEFL
jgi:hypothetical protein